jgi:hypothetical protein
MQALVPALTLSMNTFSRLASVVNSSCTALCLELILLHFSSMPYRILWIWYKESSLGLLNTEVGIISVKNTAVSQCGSH